LEKEGGDTADAQGQSHSGETEGRSGHRDEMLEFEALYAEAARDAADEARLDNNLHRRFVRAYAFLLRSRHDSAFRARLLAFLDAKNLPSNAATTFEMRIARAFIRHTATRALQLSKSLHGGEQRGWTVDQLRAELEAGTVTPNRLRTEFEQACNPSEVTASARCDAHTPETRICGNTQATESPQNGSEASGLEGWKIVPWLTARFGPGGDLAGCKTFSIAGVLLDNGQRIWIEGYQVVGLRAARLRAFGQEYEAEEE
jgi:hypothetical protein